jgi:hypothetical protein
MGRVTPAGLFLLLAIASVSPLAAQVGNTMSGEFPNESSFRFKRLWPDHSQINVALAGYREVYETDMFEVRRYNPLGPDIHSTEVRDLTSRHAYYPFVTAGASAHKIFPIRINDHLRMHLDFSGDLFFQKMITPSSFYNVVSGPTHYDIRHYNMPTIFFGSLSSGLWLSERFSAGVSYLWHQYLLETDDDRVTQLNLKLNGAGLVPWFGFWHPFENKHLSRWSVKGHLDLPLLMPFAKRFSPASATLEFLHLSTIHSGRVAGFFFKVVQYPARPGGAEFPTFSIHHDRQFLFGVNFGAGGWNRKGGR